MRLQLLPVCLLLAAAFAGPTLAADKPAGCQRTGDVENTAEIQISGTLYVELQYGPPGYGANPRTDRKDKIGILKLDDPLQVRLPFTEFHPDSVITVKEIQIVPRTPSSLDVAALTGKHVVIKGNLFEPDNSDHVRPVLIYASGGRVGGRIGCDGKEQAAGK